MMRGQTDLAAGVCHVRSRGAPEMVFELPPGASPGCISMEADFDAVLYAKSGTGCRPGDLESCVHGNRSRYSANMDWEGPQNEWTTIIVDSVEPGRGGNFSLFVGEESC